MACDNLVEHMGGFFVPQQDECLYEWIRDGMGYSKGRRVEADNFTLNPASRQPMLRPDAAWKIRHIFFNFNLPDVAVSAL